MNAYYFGSLLFGRLSNLLAVLVFSHMLIPEDFGTYSAISTNALFLYLIVGAWIPNYAWKQISNVSEEELSGALVKIRQFTLVACSGQLIACVIIFLLFQQQVDKYWIAAVGVWSVATLLLDITLVIKNARGHSREYATLTFVKGALGLLVAGILLFAGFKLWGAVIGTISGICGALLLVRSSSSIWTTTDNNARAKFSIVGPLQFGLSGVLAFNIYMLVNAVSRNIILIDLGPEFAGYAALSSDLFYAPVALFVASISLSKIPALYREARIVSERDLSNASRLLSDTMAVVLPYIVGGLFVAESIARTILSAETMNNLSMIAHLSTVQGGALALISTQTTIALTNGRVKTAVLIVMITILFVGLAHLAVAQYDLLYLYSIAFTVVVCAAATISVVLSKQLLGVSLEIQEVVKIMAASAGMGLILLVLKHIPLPFSPFSDIVVGVLVFVLSAYLLSSQSIMRLIRMDSK